MHCLLVSSQCMELGECMAANRESCKQRLSAQACSETCATISFGVFCAVIAALHVAGGGQVLPGAALCTDQFDPSSKITVGAAFMSHNVSLPNGKSMRFEIWDTAGQERYLSLAPLYYRGAHAAAVVYDITSPESFEKAKYWISELQKNASGAIVMVLVGNKADLAEQREVSDEEARAFADSQNMLFVEASAKTSGGVADIFESVAAQLAGGLPASAAAGGAA
ncbi:ras-related protein RHN1-like protein [Scenedesmus sp. NREL 46B-D3]|nr:ras-related protein RHN1-like protein [Scenedesmus sp. NREL 46B-D3]